MPASDYTKDDVVAFGKAIGNLVNAVRGDGVGADDLDELIAAVTTGAQTVNEMRDVPAAAALHTVGAAADVVGDKVLEEALEAEGGA